MTELTRRDFITALAGGFFFAPAFMEGINNKLEIKFFCPRWGAKDPWDSFCERVKSAGYDGIETPLPKDENERQELFNNLEKYNLDLILMAIPGPSGFTRHKEVYEKILQDCVKFKPLFINSHTGKDFFSFEQNRELIKMASAISSHSGVKIIHETHRGRFSFAAHITKDFLDKIHDLRLTLDISHWCNVAESLLQNQQQAVDAAIDHSDHCHARVGFQQGPQVNDPRAPEWQKALNRHLEWWDALVKKQIERGNTTFTISPEFGPPIYMPMEPYSRKPLSNQWEVNVHMMNLLRNRYA